MFDFHKKPAVSDCRQFMQLETEWPGKKPKRQKTLKGCLKDLMKDSTAWLRKCQDVWFPTHGPISNAKGATESGDELIALYDEAIARVQWVAGCAKVAEEELKKSKSRAIETQRKMKAKRQPDSP